MLFVFAKTLYCPKAGVCGDQNFLGQFPFVSSFAEMLYCPKIFVVGDQKFWDSGHFCWLPWINVVLSQRFSWLGTKNFGTAGTFACFLGKMLCCPKVGVFGEQQF